MPHDIYILTEQETPTWSVKWNHSIAIVSNWYIKTTASFSPPIDTVLRAGRPISLPANAWIVTVRGPYGDKHFLLKVTQLVNRLLLLKVIEIISKNAKNIITKFHQN